jgi:uncharacterized membrane protein YeaQ/YmgE (transglycosylase-associated protein family)
MIWLLEFLLIGLIAGWAAGKIMKGGGYGPGMDILLGIAGAFVGGWLMRSLGFYTAGGLIPAILVAIVGAIFLTWITRLIKKG